MYNRYRDKFEDLGALNNILFIHGYGVNLKISNYVYTTIWGKYYIDFTTDFSMFLKQTIQIPSNSWGTQL